MNVVHVLFKNPVSDMRQALNDKSATVRVAVARTFFEINGTDNLSEEREAALAIVKQAPSEPRYVAGKVPCARITRLLAATNVKCMRCGVRNMQWRAVVRPREEDGSVHHDVVVRVTQAQHQNYRRVSGWPPPDSRLYYRPHHS